MTTIPAEKREQVEALLRAGGSDTGIQRETGISRQTVRHIRSELGLPVYGARTEVGCRKGHPYPENAMTTKEGWTRCRACRREYDKTRNRQDRYRGREIDQAAIDMVLAGASLKLPARERAIAVKHLINRPLRTEQLAERVGCHERTVYRIRKELPDGGVNVELIARLLHEGYSNKAIAAHVHTSRLRVQVIREQLGMPAHKPGPKPAGSVEESFWDRAVPTGDGHLLWSANNLRLRVSHEGYAESVGRIAFRIRYHRDPVGQVRAGCGRRGCVHPDHVEDQPMRELARAVLGELAA